jgi:hypothetical protein
MKNLMSISIGPNNKINSSKSRELSDLMQDITIVVQRLPGPINILAKLKSNARYYIVYAYFCWDHHIIYIYRGVD